MCGTEAVLSLNGVKIQVLGGGEAWTIRKMKTRIRKSSGVWLHGIAEARIAR